MNALIDFFLMRFQPVLSPPEIGFQGYQHAICPFHLFDYNFLYNLFFCFGNAEIQFIMDL